MKNRSASIRDSVYKKAVFEFHGNANPFEYTAGDKSYFFYLTNREKCVSMMIDYRPNAYIDTDDEKYYNVLSMGYTNLWICSRSFLLHVDNQDYEIVYQSDKKADALLIICNGDGRMLLLRGDIQYGVDEAIKAIQNKKVYACLGFNILEDHFWH